uniref:Uncharacterized protein n=2 Tax=Clastoptera arizonana TaxID=38151 RepID=A0A1B6CAB5_9HEMI
MKKTELMKEKELAISRGDELEATRISQKLQELEERANELDKMRTSTISSISYINDRNRKKNVEEAEKAIMEEVRRNKGKKIDDPFTRRSTKPRMVFKANENQDEMDDPPKLPINNSAIDNDGGSKDKNLEVKNRLDGPTENLDPEKKRDKLGHAKADDLFSAHDFDIKIDLEVPLPNNPVSITPKPVNPVRESGPRRSLNLEDYKKKRGLI